MPAPGLPRRPYGCSAFQRNDQSLYAIPGRLQRGRLQGVSKSEVPPFDRTALVAALRAGQAGQTSFREFAAAAWPAGVLRYLVDLDNRTCTYFGLQDQTYVEHYAAVEVS